MNPVLGFQRKCQILWILFFLQIIIPNIEIQAWAMQIQGESFQIHHSPNDIYHCHFFLVSAAHSTMVVFYILFLEHTTCQNIHVSQCLWSAKQHEEPFPFDLSPFKSNNRCMMKVFGRD